MQVGLLRSQETRLSVTPTAAADASHDTGSSAAYIWHAFAQLHGVSIQSTPEPQHAGSFVVPATVFPSPKLQAGAAVVSSSLAASLGRPALGTDLVVYTWPAAAQPPSQVLPAKLTWVFLPVTLISLLTSSVVRSWQASSYFSFCCLLLTLFLTACRLHVI